MSTLSHSIDTVAVAAATEAAWQRLPQVPAEVVHTLHGGVYTRTARLRKGVAVCTALIKVPTTLILHGDVAVDVGGRWNTYRGTQVLVAHAGRKHVMIANEDTTITMAFPTRAATVLEAEQQFTDEWRELQTNTGGSPSTTINTHNQESQCQE